jgi:hypothetical protein|tara:strand:+ start:1657 stop:1938 length:282 start_codon:yes stop_codon:yes gene_type:complete
MSYKIEQKVRPFNANTRRGILEQLLCDMKVTKMGEQGDSLTFKAKLRKAHPDGRVSLSCKEEADVRAVGKKHGMKFKSCSDRESMTVTYWRSE